MNWLVETIAYLILFLSSLSALIAVIYGWAEKHMLSYYARAVLLFEFSGFLLYSFHHDRIWLFNIFLMVQFVMIGIYLTGQFKSASRSNLSRIFLGILGIAFALYTIKNSFWTINYKGAAGIYLLFIIGALFGLWKACRETPELKKERSPLFIFCSGLLLFATGSVLTACLRIFLGQENTELNIKLWFLDSVLSIVFNTALILSLKLIRDQRRIVDHQIQMREFNRKKQLELMQASIRSEEEERMRIASELHDDVGATLASIRLFLTQAARSPGDVNLINQSKLLLDSSIQKVRDISHQLQPETLHYLGLTKALQSFAETISRSGAINVDFRQSKSWAEPEGQTALSVYRIIQELVNNIIKHSGATLIKMDIHQYEGRDCISISHDGSGLTEAGYQEQLFKKGAIGLKNIENRLKSADLSLAFPEPKGGIYTVTLCLPLSKLEP